MSWVIIMASQVYCDFMSSETHMSFNTIPLYEGGFLNFDCSVPPSRTEELSTFTGSFTKSPSLPGVPPPQGMADDRCIIHSPPVGPVLLHLPTKDDEFFEEGFGFFR